VQHADLKRFTSGESFMHRVPEPQPPAARKLVCNLTGVTCTTKTESMWVNGLIYATIRHCDGAHAELLYARREHTLMLTLGGGSELSRVKVSGCPDYEGRDRAGCVTYAPADIERQGWYRNANLDFLVLLIDPGFIRCCEFGADPLDIPSFTN